MTFLEKKLKWVLSPSGICVHRVDPRDHLSGELNNLRFPEEGWESRLFRSASFDTNRMRYTEMVALFEVVRTLQALN